MTKRVRIGSRGSKLALIQAEKVKSLLHRVNSDWQYDIVIIKTTGDIDRTSPIHQIGGKGVFIKELENALSRNEIDIAVHSLKDMTSKPLEGFPLVGFLRPEANTDALVARNPHQRLEDLPAGSTVATGSMRRKAVLMQSYPHIRTVDIRGNVNTRLQKLQSGEFDALLLSEAGLIRLGVQDVITQRFDPAEFCPAPGQGVITIQNNAKDTQLLDAIVAISDPEQVIKSKIELSFLERLEFNCHTPLGACTTIAEKNVHMQLFLANEAMDRFLNTTLTWALSDAHKGARNAADMVVSWLKDLC